MNFRKQFVIWILLTLSLGARVAANAGALKIDPAEKHQVMEGFGTCLVSWKPAVLAYQEKEAFTDYYLNMLGASALRIDLWCNSSLTPRERWQDITWRDFTFEGDGARGKFFVDMVRRLHSASDGKLRVIATVWSPPAWMKANEARGNTHTERKNYAINLGSPEESGLWNGPLDMKDGEERYQYVGRNKLRADRYLHFAKVLVEWTRYFRSLGVDLYALSAQNELVFSHWFESAVYTPKEYAELLRVIAWMFAHEGEKQPQMFGPEHMTYDTAKNRLYLEALAAQPSAMASLGAVASHGYIDGYMADRRPDSPAAFRKMAETYGKKIWMTEGGTGKHEWPAPLHEAGVSFHNALTEGGVSLLTPWVAVDDVANEHGLTAISGHTKKTSVTMQYFRFIRPGMVRIGISDEAGRLAPVAYQDPVSRQVVLVLLNRTKETAPVSLQLTDSTEYVITGAYLTDSSHDCAKMEEWKGQGQLTLPAESVTTLLLQPRK